MKKSKWDAKVQDMREYMAFFFFFFFLTALRGMWDHTSLTRDPVLSMVKVQKS